MTQRYFAGDTVGKTFYFKNESDALFDPDTISVTIIKPDDTTQATLTKTDLTKTATGTYKMKWNLPDSASTGMWKLKVTATQITGTLKNTEEFTFIVEES